MSGGMAGALAQQAPVEQRAAVPNPMLSNMQSNLMNQFAARLMGPQQMAVNPIQSLLMGAGGRQGGQNQYQQAFQQMLPSLLAPPSFPTMGTPYNPRVQGGTNPMGPAPEPAVPQYDPISYIRAQQIAGIGQ